MNKILDDIWPYLLLIFVLLFSTFVSVFFNYVHPGDISNVSLSVCKSDKYSKKEINDAISLVEKKINKDFTNITLNEVIYNNNQALEKEYQERYNNKYVIIIKTVFKTKINPGVEGLNDNTTYTYSFALSKEHHKDEWTLRKWSV